MQLTNIQYIILKHLKGSKAGQIDEFPVVDYKELMIGRDSICTVRYDPEKDDLVSRHHAKIVQDKADLTQFEIIDLGSRNGTYVNKERIIPGSETRILPGWVIQFGPGGPELEFDLSPRPVTTAKETRIAIDTREFKKGKLKLSAEETRIAIDTLPIPIGSPWETNFTGISENQQYAKMSKTRPRISQPLNITLNFRLHEKFRYVHEPLIHDDTAIPFLEHQMYVQKLKERILYSTGGSFLVTGFRGVGKTTIIKRTINELINNDNKNKIFIPIFLNIAKPVNSTQLLFEMIRRLFETLLELNILNKLSPEIANAITLSYARTSLSFKQTKSNSIENTIDASIAANKGDGFPTLISTLLKTFSPKISTSRRSINSRALESTFLTYSDMDVEHDFLRIIELLRKGFYRKRNFWQHILLKLKLYKEPIQKNEIKVIVVLDEIDKLTSGEDGIIAFDSILNILKNILTTRGVCFIFCGGVDLHDKWLKDVNRGDSVYESIFAWQLYIPCLWNGAELLIKKLFLSPNQHEEIIQFQNYLKFKGRGIPRRLLQEFNQFVKWQPKIDRDIKSKQAKSTQGIEENKAYYDPYCEINEFDFERLKFYSYLYQLIESFEENISVESIFPLEIDQDRLLLGRFYVMEYILKTYDRIFTIEDIYATEDSIQIRSSFAVSKKYIQRFVDHLVENEIVENITGDSLAQTLIGDVPTSQEKRYRISKDIIEKLKYFAKRNVQERISFNESQYFRQTQTPGTSGSLGYSGDINQEFYDFISRQYEVISEIGRGGMGIVYKAKHKTLGNFVAIKTLVANLKNNEKALIRLRREAKLSASLNHPNIVKIYDIIEISDHSVAIVMEYVSGKNLSELIISMALDQAKSILITISICDALMYLQKAAIYRIDIKPSNIIIKNDSTPVLVDLGIAKSKDDFSITEANETIGTPFYMAPEQISGKAVDIRTDIYSLGIVLYEMISGHPPWSSAYNIAELMYVKVHERFPITELNTSNKLKKIIEKATSIVPKDRFQTPEEMKTALQEIVEKNQY
jgi:serine/threonine-protein kinase